MLAVHVGLGRTVSHRNLAMEKRDFDVLRPDNPITTLMGFRWRQSRECVAICFLIHTGGLEWGSHLSSLILALFGCPCSSLLVGGANGAARKVAVCRARDEQTSAG
jgi:hypothetical protein